VEKKQQSSKAAVLQHIGGSAGGDGARVGKGKEAQKPTRPSNALELHLRGSGSCGKITGLAKWAADLRPDDAAARGEAVRSVSQQAWAKRPEAERDRNGIRVSQLDFDTMVRPDESTEEEQVRLTTLENESAERHDEVMKAKRSVDFDCSVDYKSKLNLHFQRMHRPHNAAEYASVEYTNHTPTGPPHLPCLPLLSASPARVHTKAHHAPLK
jgi:hypothetical protein